MSKTLVLAEKPSVGKDIARVLNCTKKGNGFFEGDQYIVTWALGHLVTLADPEAYGEQYKTWRLEDLPLLPERLQLVVIRESGKQFQIVKAQMTRKDVNQIVIATDAGREGELVARWIIEKIQLKKPLKRLWISSVTDKAIRDGFQKLRDGKAYENLYASAVARAEADWLVGINATRALTCQHNAQLSCGRVQTPTLAIIAKREEERNNFVPKTYYRITASSGSLKLYWQDAKSGETRIFDQQRAEKIAKAVKQQRAEIIEVHKVLKKSYAPQLYDLTELQREANKRFGFSAKETLSAMQSLYERHKVLTYPRTDSRYLSSDIVATLPERIKACSAKPYAAIAAKVMKQPIKANKSFVDDQKVSDHHAIIPTEQRVSLTDLSDRERKIYDLVVRRFLAVLLPPFEYEQTTIKTALADQLFVAKGKIVIAQGWKEAYEEAQEDEGDADEIREQLLPNVSKGEILPITGVNLATGETQPPELFTEGTLLSAMENPARYMAESSKELARTLDETGGLGTVATRADIIEKLFKSFLIEKRGKYLTITSKGKQLLELVPADLKTPALTAEWEQKLAAIAKGQLAKDAFLREMRGYAKQVVLEIKNSQHKFKHDNLTRSKCPECGKLLLEVKGKTGKMLVCQDRECGYRKTVARTTNARCPQCHKRLELHGEGAGQTFVCQCGYKEKLASFTERRAKEKSGKLSRKEVAQYLKKQEREANEPLNPALMEALSKLKFDE
ncbi:DNA topoisomerase III [Brevibacillus fulvus]|uniref:DNA topoisomerase 3 n=1 Tax=Brevibacillus fulvus TaxID=1125967 RepID=A0A938Y359_9BACL|nr:DNA topoisomerase III [Brevibacillus fulvus]MBM7591111.1 DNA topoisomerase-3 [Brevibacillus fulvus]